IISFPAFRRAARDIVLHAKSGEHFQLAVIHFHGNGNFKNPFRRAKNLAESGIELQKFSGHIKLELRDAKRIQIGTGRYPFSRERKLQESVSACEESGGVRDRASEIQRPYQIGAARCETDSDLREAPCAVQSAAEPPSSTWPFSMSP